MQMDDRPRTLLGASAAMRQLQEEVQIAARSNAKVLITGESGVGKEIVAGQIHRTSARRQAAFVTINCAGVPDALLQTELFGHVRGSFTDAYKDKAGMLELAHRGTAFLDEAGEMSLPMQSVLLRFLETGEIHRVGSDRVEDRVDVRIVAATNRNLSEAMAAKRFREDLYYRLNVVALHIPPLRERPEDIPLLLEHFFAEYSARYLVEPPHLSKAATAELLAYHWPGNVRELKNMAERLTVRAPGRMVNLGDLALEGAPLRRPALAITQAAASSPLEAMSQLMGNGRESFWSVVYPTFMARDMTRKDLRQLVKAGLERAGGNYRAFLQQINIPLDDSKKFLSFLRKYQCHEAFQQAMRSKRVPELPPEPLESDGQVLEFVPDREKEVC
jgi:transcriptional regulator with PAS, ATPase and Fis domain